MTMKVTCFLFSFVLVYAWAEEGPIFSPPKKYDQLSPKSPSYDDHAYYYPAIPPKYDYSYGIKDDYSGANFAQSESRDGERTQGQYSVDLPDGRRQIVTYYDDGHGLVAEVKYEGEAVYPEYAPNTYKEEPSYKPLSYYKPQVSYKDVPSYKSQAKFQVEESQAQPFQQESEFPVEHNFEEEQYRD